jgi:hypothetical protein
LVAAAVAVIPVEVAREVLEPQQDMQSQPLPLSQSQLAMEALDHRMTVQEVMVTYQYLDQ